jgi:hypothetical protein
MLDSNAAITYDQWLTYAGYIAVTEDLPNTGTILCQGNIGTH